MANRVYYILFDSYEQALEAREGLLDEGVDNRIAPAPYSLLGVVSCGMALLLKEEAERAEQVLKERKLVYHAIVPYEGALNPKRDRYC